MEIERRRVIQQGADRSMEQIMQEMLQAYYTGITNYSNSSELQFIKNGGIPIENESEIEPINTDIPKTNTDVPKTNTQKIEKPRKGENKDKFGIYITEDLRRQVEEAAKNLREYIVGNKVIFVHPDIGDRIAKANEEMKRETGKEIKISHHYRTLEKQLDLWLKSWKGEPMKSKRRYRAAKPGVSNHNYGLAIDVVNWQEAEPYLRKYGLRNDIPDDRVHFSLNGR